MNSHLYDPKQLDIDLSTILKKFGVQTSEGFYSARVYRHKNLFTIKHFLGAYIVENCGSDITNWIIADSFFGTEIMKLSMQVENYTQTGLNYEL